ncbi:MAG: hypothetical protein JNL74_01895, partial [Fibrobacteres bacterium]|nr:hypothetical protein [Fibrobacterota bacterium]
MIRTLLLLLTTSMIFGAAFTESPSLVKQGTGSWQVKFTIDAATDVAVS